MLGIAISERTVSRYVPRRTPPPDAVQRWRTFLQNHRAALAAMDFFVVPTVTFRLAYVWFVIGHDRRRILHVDVTANPAAPWVIQQLPEAFPFGTAPRHLIFDRDAIFSAPVVSTMRSFGIQPTRTAFRLERCSFGEGQALTLEIVDVTVVHEAIGERRGDGAVVEHASPFRQTLVRGDARTVVKSIAKFSTVFGWVGSPDDVQPRLLRS